MAWPAWDPFKKKSWFSTMPDSIILKYKLIGEWGGLLCGDKFREEVFFLFLPSRLETWSSLWSPGLWRASWFVLTESIAFWDSILLGNGVCIFCFIFLYLALSAVPCAPFEALKTKFKFIRLGEWLQIRGSFVALLFILCLAFTWILVFEYPSFIFFPPISSLMQPKR